MKKVFISGLVMLSLMVVAVPQLVSAAPTVSGGCYDLGEQGISGVVSCFAVIFNYAIYLMIAGSVVYIVYGAFNMITSEEKREEGKKTIYYGIIGLFVMVSIWGFVAILDNTFNLSEKSGDSVFTKEFIKVR